eukprot:TRINITY_DN10277_c0_g1_i1.p1 TRINITY_DN10277_c0_g1~~TRINITY_DN10277_c0_g1_i1.p1  ORF type:complete len:394 (-),score=49.60 TRINITY_DN10277_c0_g1_i1:128-1309(-)
MGVAEVEDDVDIFEWEVRDNTTPFAVHALAGSCAGVAEHVAIFPLDTVKTTMQTSTVNSTMLETTQRLVRERGVRGLFRGSMAIGFGCIPAHVAFFGTYEHASARLRRPGREELQVVESAISGGLAAVAHDTILTPHDVVKQRLQLGHYGGVRDCIRSMVRTEGLGVFFRSLPVTMAMNIPYTGILVATNDSLKWALQRRSDCVSDAPMHFLLAGVSGAVAATATLPFDVVKTALQTEGLRSASSSASSSQSFVASAVHVRSSMIGVPGLSAATFAEQQQAVSYGLLRCFSSGSCATSASGANAGGGVGAAAQAAGSATGTVAPACASSTRSGAGVVGGGGVAVAIGIVQRLGVRGLFRGLGPRVALAAPAAGISWGTYETVRGLLCRATDTL